MPKQTVFGVSPAKYLLKEKHFLLTAVGVFPVFTLLTAPLFSMIAYTGGYIQLVNDDSWYYLKQQASAQEQSIPPTLPFTPFSLQQDQEGQEQDTIAEEGQQNTTTPMNQTGIGEGQSETIMPPLQEQQQQPANQNATAAEPPPGCRLTTAGTVFCPPGTEPPSNVEAMPQPFFFLEDEIIPVTIGMDELGVVALDNVTSDQLQEYLSGFQLELIHEYPQNIFIFGLPGNLSRSEIVNLSRTIASEGEQFVAYAGFTATSQGAETPSIVTDEFIAQFKPGISDEQIASFNNDNRVEIIRPDPFVEDEFFLKVTEASPFDALDMANRYQESNLTLFAHPNFIVVTELRQVPPPNDPLFGNQWHHQNDGLAGGTADADVDTPLAWDITVGAPETVIAVIDDGFDMTHPDLTPNLWDNPGEVRGKPGIDDDKNGIKDDIHGADFVWDAWDGWDGDPSPETNDKISGSHGTAAAGTAAARGNNALGVTGSCPDCRLMLIRFGATVGDNAAAIRYAAGMGADIITMSWSYKNISETARVYSAITDVATEGRGGLGVVVLIAMSDTNTNDCPNPPTDIIGGPPDMSSHPHVIGVSLSTNRDRFDLAGFGNCMDVLAPGAGGRESATSGRGSLKFTTTDRQGEDGYNNWEVNNNKRYFCPVTEPAPPPADARDYTFCFGGTSAATPLVAGIAGLILTVNPDLTRLEVQRLLQDSADKIEHSVGGYAKNNGFSTPTGTGVATFLRDNHAWAPGIATHGWGRVNAFEAVRIAAPVTEGGLGGVDIFLRDNWLDWGNTEQPSNTLFEPTRSFLRDLQNSIAWSEDIKVDAPPYQSTPITGADFERLDYERPSEVPGDINRVYVRVHNRGPVTDPSMTVKLLWNQFNTDLPPQLPSDFWTAFPADSSDTTQWHPLSCADGRSSSTCTITNLDYSGSSVAATTDDEAKIVAFDLPAFDLLAPPAVESGYNFILLAMIDSLRDPISSASRSTLGVHGITPADNNISYRSYPYIAEICANQLDDNGNSLVDEEPCEPPDSSPGVGGGRAKEDCRNGIDDDNDSFVDFADGDCILEPEEP